jgi:hypothetical protein
MLLETLSSLAISARNVAVSSMLFWGVSGVKGQDAGATRSWAALLLPWRSWAALLPVQVEWTASASFNNHVEVFYHKLVRHFLIRVLADSKPQVADTMKLGS